MRGKGFYQMMDGIEVGRVDVAARACGIPSAPWARDRLCPAASIGKPIAEHQAILFRLADMDRMRPPSQLMVNAARLKDAGQRNDLEAGMAKCLASETAPTS